MRRSMHSLGFCLPVLGFLAGTLAVPPDLQRRHADCLTLATPDAHAGPLRRPRLHTLLVDLTHIEANNGERDDRRTAHLIEQQIIGIRVELLRSMSGEVPFPTALQATLNGLYAIAGHNNRSTDNDFDLVSRVAGSVEQMRLRAEQILLNLGKHAAPPAPAAYRRPMALYVPEPYLPPTAPPPALPPVYRQAPIAVPPAPPIAQFPSQPPIYQPPDPPPTYPQTGPGYPQPTPGYPQPQPYPQLTGMPMSPSQFQGLLGQVQRLAFSDEKLNAIQDAVRSGYYFTCEQIVQLMHTSAFGDDQVKIGSMLYPQAVDPQNFSLLTSALTFESDRQRLRKACGR